MFTNAMTFMKCDLPQGDSTFRYIPISSGTTTAAPEGGDDQAVAPITSFPTAAEDTHTDIAYFQTMQYPKDVAGLRSALEYVCTALKRAQDLRIQLLKDESNIYAQKEALEEEKNKRIGSTHTIWMDAAGLHDHELALNRLHLEIAEQSKLSQFRSCHIWTHDCFVYQLQANKEKVMELLDHAVREYGPE